MNSNSHGNSYSNSYSGSLILPQNLRNSMDTDHSSPGDNSPSNSVNSNSAKYNENDNSNCSSYGNSYGNNVANSSTINDNRYSISTDYDDTYEGYNSVHENSIDENSSHSIHQIVDVDRARSISDELVDDQEMEVSSSMIVTLLLRYCNCCTTIVI